MRLSWQKSDRNITDISLNNYLQKISKKKHFYTVYGKRAKEKCGQGSTIVTRASVSLWIARIHSSPHHPNTHGSAPIKGFETEFQQFTSSWLPQRHFAIYLQSSWLILPSHIFTKNLFRAHIWAGTNIGASRTRPRVECRLSIRLMH